VFGPQPRSYTTELPRKVKQLARKSALNARARENALHVVERLAFRSPKTAQMAELLQTLGLEGTKVLVLTTGHEPNVYLSGRNIPTVEVLRYAEASAYDILWAEAVVVEEGALTGVAPDPLADEEPTTEGKPKRAKKATKPAKAAKAANAAKAAKTSAATKAAKKSAKATSAKASGAKAATKKSSARKGAPKKKEK
jgi:hypothetical protein